MIGGAALLLPIIVNNAMHAYDEEEKAEHKNNNNAFTDDEIIYMRERKNKPWDGFCHISPNTVCVCNVHPFTGENKYTLTKENN